MCGNKFYYIEQPEVKERTHFRTPAVDIVESAESFTITANLPGVAKENVKVNVKDRQLIIEGILNPVDSEEKTDAAETEKVTYLLKERRKGNFYRKFNLGDSIDTENVEANYENGVLAVTLKKKAETQPKTINIK